MSLPALDNLVRIRQLKAEPRNEAEARRMLAMALTRLADAQVSALSPQGRFTSRRCSQAGRITPRVQLKVMEWIFVRGEFP